MFLVGIQFPCQDEEVVAEAVDIGNDVCIDFCAFFGKGKDASFCSSADGAADVCDGCGSASSWQDEAAEAGQDGVDGVNLLLDACHHLVGHDGSVCLLTCGVVVGVVVCGKIASHHKKMPLHVGEELAVVLVGAIGDEQPDVGAEFVDGAIRFQSGAGLADPLSACEGCDPLVACTCVDFHNI